MPVEQENSVLGVGLAPRASLREPVDISNLRPPVPKLKKPSARSARDLVAAVVARPRLCDRQN